MDVIRAFIAIDLPAEILHNLQQVSVQLQQRLIGIPLRWVPTQNIHLTLKFLGEVSVNNLDLIKEILQVEAEKHAGFEVSMGELGAFPSLHRPRVVWVGVQAPPVLITIQHEIEAQTTRLGYAPEERQFSPHLTLGRVAHNITPQEARQIGETLTDYKAGSLGTTRIEALHLYRSELSQRGATYTRLHSASLQ